MKILEAHDVPAAPLYDIAEVLDDPQVKHLGLIEEVEHPKAGKLKFVGGPVRFDNLAKEKTQPPPLVGEHSERILRELGHDDAAIQDLRDPGRESNRWLACADCARSFLSIQ